MPWQDFEIVGFMPDLPSNAAPGLIFASANGTQSYGFYPTAKGFRNGPTPETISTVGGTSGAVDTVPLGSAIVYNPDGGQRCFIGTAAKLWEYDFSTTITDRSGSAYAATAANSWSFTQYGGYTIAAHRGAVLQKIISPSAAFSAIGAAPVPQASIVVTCGPVSAPFVMAFDFNDGTHDWTDGWFNSAISDPITSAAASWTVGTSQCAQGRLLDDLPGPVICAIPFRDEVIAFKQQGIYIGSYGTKIETGWSWERRSHDIGALGKNCAISIEDMVFWSDRYGLWQYDGSYPRRLPGYVHRWWAEQVLANTAGTANYRHLARTLWDANRRNIWFLLPDVASGVHTTGVVYNVDSQLWFPVYTIHNTANTAMVYDLIGMTGQYGFFIGADKKLGLLVYDLPSGGPSAAAMTFGVIGDNVNQHTCTGFRPVILRTGLGASTVSCLVRSGPYWRDNMVPGGTALTDNHTFVSNSDKLHQDGTAADRFLQPALLFAADNTVEVAAKGGKILLQTSGTGGA